jgi:hypothetical protein
MQAIDRLGWAAGLVVDAHGVRLGIRTSRADVLEQVRACLPPGSVPAEGGEVEGLFSLKVGEAPPGARTRPFTLLFSGITRLARTPYLSDALHALEQELGRFVAERSRKALFVHAGVVGWRGRALVLPGRSRAGKSTLVQALIQAGAEYLSDEYAVIDPEGRVHPYPRDLSQRLPGSVLWRGPVADLGGRNATGPLPLGVVAFTEYREGVIWRPRPVPAGQAVFEMARHSSAALDDPGFALPILERAVAGAVRVRGLRGEAAGAATELLDLCQPQFLPPIRSAS